MKGAITDFRVMGALSSSEDCMIVAEVVSTQCQRVTDGQTVRRTESDHNLLVLAALSYADAL